MKFCTFCGAEMQDADNFCGSCAQPIQAPVQNHEQAQEQPVFSEQTQIQPEQPLVQQPVQPQYQQPYRQPYQQPYSQMPVPAAPANNFQISYIICIIGMVLAFVGQFLPISTGGFKSLNTFDFLEIVDEYTPDHITSFVGCLCAILICAVLALIFVCCKKARVCMVLGIISVASWAGAVYILMTTGGDIKFLGIGFYVLLAGSILMLVGGIMTKKRPKFYHPQYPPQYPPYQ